MLKKFLIFIYIIIIIAAVFYMIKFFTTRQEAIEVPAQQKTEVIESAQKKDLFKNEEKSEDTKKPEKENVSDDSADINEEPEKYEITTENCNSECSKFKGDKKEYCQNICGLNMPTKEDVDCENLNGIEKDYCVKDFSIEENDLKKCNDIADKGIKNQCKNRIQETIIDQIM